MHAVLTEEEQAIVDSIILHHLLQEYPTAHHRYIEAKRDLLRAQIGGDYPISESDYNAAINRFVIAFGV